MSIEGVVSDNAAPRRIPLRIAVALHTLALFTQAVLAGQFLSGSDGAVVFHEVTGWIILALCVAQLILSFVAERIPLWFPISTAFVLLCELLQIGTGYGRFLGVHIPLAILTFGLLMGQALWTFFV